MPDPAPDAGPAPDRPRPRDPARWPLLALALVGLLALGLDYTRRVLELPDGIRAALTQPEAHDGERLVLPVWFVAGVDGPRRYRVSRILKDVPVEGPSEGLQAGQVITVVGQFRAQDRTVVELRRTVHRHRAAKHALSLLGLLVALAAAPFAFTWQGGYLRLREAPRA